MGWDVDSIVKVVILLVFVFGGIIQFLYRTFFKPLAEAEARRRREMAGGKPPQTLRDLLAEIRGEAQAPPEERPVEGALLGEAPQAPREPKHPHRDLVWEAVEESRPVEPAPPAPLPGGPADGWGGEPAPARRERPKPARREPRPRAPQRAKAEPAIEAAPDAESARRGPSVESRKLKSGIEDRFKASAGRDVRARPLSRHLPEGLTLREAVISQIILGPPRCRQRYAPSSGLRNRRPPPAGAGRSRP